ncbi:hypothetical protein [Plantactinospora sp. CA-290183]|uniref:hypothetical protein n=1 Tax=Plantactinospora sp. CA-290183 TaxID=3240006 RepID=UPI003D8AA462
MTDTDTAAQAAADNYLAAVRAYIAGPPVDLQNPTDRLIEALTPGTPGGLLAEVLNATADLIRSYWKHAARENAEFAQRMTLSGVHAVAAAVDAALHPFDRADELAAAEQRVADLERQVAQVGRDLEQAVAAGDVDQVMKLRGTAEVTLPGQLGEARGQLLRLRIDAAQAQLDAAAPRTAATADAAKRAEQAVIDAHGQARRATTNLTAARLDAQAASGTRSTLAASVSALRAELQRHDAEHQRDQQARIRRLAGLTAVNA